VPPRGADAQEAGGVNRARAAPLRSWLFVPGDSERKQAKALLTRADALILDLEDSVDPAQLPAARARVAVLLTKRPAGPGPQLWVRVNAPSSSAFNEDLLSVCRFAMPDGLVLPKVSAAAEIVATVGRLAALDSTHGLPAGRTRLLALVTETPQGLLALPNYPELLARSPATVERLAGFTWGAEDLSAALGATAKRTEQGVFTPPFQHARTSCLLAAAALAVQAVDGVYTDFRDAAGLERELKEARRDGFSGKLAIHPDQVAAINAAFTPTEAERAHARRVIAAFAAAPGAGVASLDGQMLDRPHLLQAQRVLAAAEA